MTALNAYKDNPDSAFQVGQRIRFQFGTEWVEDTVRACFWQYVTVQPWGEDLIFPALVLTEHSWILEASARSV